MSDNEVLVVASKIKTYIKNSGEMKTSAGVLEVLSDRLLRNMGGDDVARVFAPKALGAWRLQGGACALDLQVPLRMAARSAQDLPADLPMICP